MSFYDFKASLINGREVSLEEYKDKVVLVAKMFLKNMALLRKPILNLLKIRWG